MEIGIGIFHKEYLDGVYVCDYVLAHNMKNFLNLVFNFCRYMFRIDQYTNKIEFYFDVQKLKDEMSILHFLEFEEKCRRLGEVYVKINEDKLRKYVLRRNLFQEEEN